MAGTSCEAICKDLEAIHGFLRAQARLADTTAAQRNHCENIITRIMSFDDLDFVGATALTNVFETGPWTLDQKQSMCAAVQDKLRDVAIGKPNRPRRKNQTCSSFDRYLSVADMGTLTDSTAGL